MKTDAPVLLDFDEVYPAQDFYTPGGCRWLRHGFMHGVGAYCSPRARQAVSRWLDQVTEPAVCFFGSGNYHYLCLLLLERIRRDFTLLLFDHHSDAQVPAFGRMLTCGSWVREALRTLPNLRQIVWVGATAGALPGLPARQKWLTVPCAAAVGRQLIGAVRYPAYVSVDKDIFGRQTARTNWNQGTWNMEDFVQVFTALTAGRPLLGMDVCGEFPARYGGPSEFRAASRLNSAANRRMLDLWRQAG